MKTLIAVILLFGSIFLSASQKQNSTNIQESPYVIISIRTDANEYMRALVDGAKLFAKSIGSEDKVITLYNHGSSEKQVQDLQLTLQKTGSNAILYMDSNDEANLKVLANIAKEHEVYFSTVWNKPKDFWPWEFGKYWVTHTTPDYILSGSMTAQEIFNKMDGEGNILVMQGRPDNTSSKGRIEGLKNVLKNYPNIKILDTQPANWSRVEASMLVTKWLAKYNIDDIKAIWAANDEMALGVVEVMKEIGLDKKMLISGVDGTGEAIRSVVSKDFVCTVSVDPYWQSGMGLSFAYQAYLGNIKPSKLSNDKRAFFSKSKLVNSQNSKSFLKNYIENPPTIDYTKLWEGKYNRPMK